MYPVVNLPRTPAPRLGCGHAHSELAGVRDAHLLSGTQPPPPGVCCQMTEDGLSVICSDGQGFNSQCPKCPYPNTPGYAKYQQVGSQLIPIPPKADMCAGTGSDAPVAPGEGGGLSAPLIGLGLLGAGVAAYFLFLR